MDLSQNGSLSNDGQFRFAVVIYCAVLFAGFVFGLYGLISLLSLASREVERNAHILSTLL